MITQQYNFDIEIPKEVISDKKHDSVFFDLIKNKSIIGCLGYSRSGKDTTAKILSDNYGFHRVAFADIMKDEMNSHLKKAVYNFLKNINPSSERNTPGFDDWKNGLLLEDERVLTLGMIDFKTEEDVIKKRLRPFMIWYAEKLREINGSHYWINRAFETYAVKHDRIVLTDVRRAVELDIFKGSNIFTKRTIDMFANAGCVNSTPKKAINSYSTILLHINQLGLKDSDSLTHECVRVAQENWMLDSTVYIDPRLPERGGHREKSLVNQVKNIASKYGISKPDKNLNYPRKQLSMF